MTMMSGETLFPEHLADFERSGLSTNTIKQSGARSVTQLEAKQLLGFDPGSGGWILPYPHREGLPDTFDFKPATPFTGSDGKSRKYLRPLNSMNRVYIPPILPMERLQSKREMLVITEGAKKSLKAVQEGVVSIALSGVWNWKFRDSMNDSRTIEDLTDVWLKGREILICFDSDVVSKPQVAAAEFKLAKKLRELGAAKVEGIRIPAGLNGGKVGADDYLLTHTKEDFFSLPRDPLITPPENNVKDMPQIVITGQFMRQTTEKAVQAIQKSNQPSPHIFLYGSQIVRVNNDSVIEALSIHSLRGILDRVADFCKLDTAGNPKPTRPPLDVVQDLMSLHDLPFPKLNGVSSVPVLLPDGRLLNKSGYDAKSCLLLYLDEFNDLKVDMQPEDAIKLLTNDVFVDFPFADASGMAHTICAMLLPFVRRIIEGPTPFHLFEADSRGTGKGLLMDVIAVTAMGRPAEPMSFPKNEEEIEKRILSSLMSGASIVFVDNVTHIKSPALCIALTTELYRGRILGKSEMKTLPNYVTWLGTGNNPQLSDEMVRRTASIRLVSDTDRPEERQGFKHANLPLWVKQNRSKIVNACLSIVGSWVNAGMRQGSATLGRFESWAGVMSGILDHISVPGFLSDRDRLHTENDSDSTEWSALCEVWYEAYGERAITAKNVCDIARKNDLLLDVWAGKNELAGQQRMGHALSAKRDRVFKSAGFAGFKIQAAGQDSRTRSAAYRLYTINLPQYKKTTETTEIMQARINKGPEGQAMSGSVLGLRGFSHETPVLTDNIPFFDEEVEL